MHLGDVFARELTLESGSRDTGFGTHSLVAVVVRVESVVPLNKYDTSAL